MALTRAQLLAGNNAQGTVLPGQVQAVTAGSGVLIAANGQLSVDATTVQGLVKLNNGGAYNAYVWPNVDGTNGEFLQTDGAGNLTWATPQGFAVVTVSNFAPAPADIGELWFDCTTGTLNVYQGCVGTPSPNWFNVAQPGLPVLPGNTSATPAFTGGDGTLATPYDCIVTTTGAGTTVYVVNTVTIGGLAPFQYVPIVDLNAVTNGGRFSFSNYYADGGGALTFQTIFTDLPASGSGTSYTAAIKVGYGTVYIDAVVNVVSALVVTGGTITGPSYVGQQLTYVPGTASGGSTPYVTTYQWLADGVVISGATNLTYTVAAGNLGKTITARTNVTDAASQSGSGISNGIGPILANPGVLTVSNPGSISPSAGVTVGTTLTYTTGTFTGGIPTVTQSWVWKRGGTPITGTTNAPTYTTVSADAGQGITVTYTVTDSATPAPATASGTTTSVTPTEPFPTSVWNPTPAGGMTTIPGGISATYNGTGTSITTTGCIEASVNGGAYSVGTQSISSGQTLATRWSTSGACGGAASGTALTGTITDGTYLNTYNITVNRLPGAFTFSPITNAGLASVQTSNSVSITGINTTAYVTAGAASTGSTIQGSTDAGVTWAAIPASGTGFPIANSSNLLVRLTTNGTPSSTNTAVINVGDGDNVQKTTSTFTVTNTSTASFPNTSFSPSGGPNASPDTVSVGALVGTATATWADGNQNLTATGSLQFKVNAGSYGQSSTPVVDNDTVSLIWDPTAISGAANGATLTGTLTNGTFINSYSIVIDREVTGLAFTDLTLQSLNTQVQSNTITPAGYNVPVSVSFAGTGSNPLTSLGISVQGGSFSASPQTVNPGQTIQMQGTTGSGTSTAYGVDITMGQGSPAATDTWTASTTAAVPSIATPSITSPSDGTGNLNPAVNSPAGIPLVGSTYTPQNGAGAVQTSSTWEVYKGGFPLTSTNSITSVSSVAPASTWTPVSSSFGTSDIYGVYYNGSSLYMAGGTNGKMATSPDGVTWTQRTSGWTSANTDIISGFASNGSGQYVMTGGQAIGGGLRYLATSTDNGVTWTPRTSNYAQDGVIKSVTYGAGKYVAVGNNGGTISSSDGVTWTNITGSNGGSGGDWGQIVFANGLFVCVGSRPGADQIRTSADGVTWTARSGPFTNADGAADVTFGGGLFVVVGAGGKIATSSNGTTWTTRTSGTTTALNTVAYQGGTYIVGTSSSTFLHSADGVTWTSTSSNFSGRPYVLTTGASKLFGGGTSGYLATSSGSGSTTLTISNCQTDGFLVGDTVISDPAAAGPAIILAVSNTAVTVVPSSASWAIGQKIKRDPSSYTAITGSPFSVTSAPFTTVNVPQASLTTSSTYYARVQYATTNASAATSSYSGWSSFATSAVFAPNPGTAMGGGYFGGQINDGGIIYNLIVGPVASAQNGGATPAAIQYKTTNTADTPAATFQNEVYGFPASQAGNNANHPAFQFVRGLSISGYNDWYIPAKNELEVLYYFLKPTTGANVTSSGSNPNAVSPEPVSTNYTSSNPAQTTSALFQTGGAQAFDTANSYWSSSEISSSTGNAWTQLFNNGLQNSSNLKSNSNFARAIRREYANAPVAIGAAFGGGYFAGQYQDGGITYNLIVAPVATGQFGGATPTTIQYKTSATGDTNPNSQNAVYGKLATDQFNDTDHPAFQWAKGLTIATLSDWYIPALNELAILSANLGPNWTTSTDFKAGTGAQAFATTHNYWSSSEYALSTGRAWSVDFANNNQNFSNKDGTISSFIFTARAVRRVVA